MLAPAQPTEVRPTEDTTPLADTVSHVYEHELEERVADLEKVLTEEEDTASVAIKELKDRVTSLEGRITTLEALLLPKRVVSDINTLPVEERNHHLQTILLVAAGATVALTVAKTVKL